MQSSNSMNFEFELLYCKESFIGRVVVYFYIKTERKY